ncbi:hypothetical protein Tco_0834270 [Tanacetum coccineum]
MNDLERHDLLPKRIVTNTKLLNCLQTEWKQYVTIERQTSNLHGVNYDHLYDHLKHNQKESNETHSDEEEDESTAICIMIERIKEVDTNSTLDANPSYDIDGLSKVPNYNTCFNNELYFVSANDQKHPEQPESINNTYIVDQLDNIIIFDSLDMDINRGVIEQDETSHDQNNVAFDSLLKNM